MTRRVPGTQGSNAERAEGGLNPEASFAELDETTAARMATETDGDIAARVKRQLDQAPGGKGAAYGRGEYGEP